MESSPGTLVSALGLVAATASWGFTEHTVFELVSHVLTEHGVPPADTLAQASTFVLPSAIFAGGLYAAYQVGRRHGRKDKTNQEAHTTNQEARATDENFGSTTLVITPDPALLRADFRFGVLYVKDGRAYVLANFDIKNEEIPFRKLDDWGTLSVTITHSPVLGCQFKCFIDHPGFMSEQIAPHLEASGFLEPSASHGQAFRTYFLLPGHLTCPTPEGWTNNMKYSK